MNLADPTRSERLDALAAQYVLGTLGPRARRRLAAIARRDATVAAAIAAWDGRLSGLAAGVAPVVPAPRVWNAIRHRLGFTDDRGATGAVARTPWWSSLGWWRALATVGFVLAIAFGVSLFAPGPERAEQVVVVLAGPDAKPALIATADRGSRLLNVKAVAPVQIAAGRALELWMLPQGQNPRSLGLIPATGIGRVTLPDTAGAVLQNIPALAVSVEPAGGSPTGLPTGPVIYTGAVQRFY
jgi:anti-sigma-K factor RskA